MQLTILRTCLSLCLTRDLQNLKTLTSFTILQGKVITFWKYVENSIYIFLEFSKLSNSGISFNWRSYNPQYNSLLFWPTLYYVKQNETELFYFCNTFIKPFSILAVFSINIL